MTEIGSISVDSGQIIICSGTSIAKFKDTGFKDIRIFKDIKTGKEYQYGKDFNHFETKLLKNKTVNELIKSHRLVQVEIPINDKEFTYDSVSQATIQKDYYIFKKFKCFAARSGYGDGSYPLYQTKNGYIISFVSSIRDIKKKKFIGTINFNGLVVTDPCYIKDMELGCVLPEVKGKYDIYLCRSDINYLIELTKSITPNSIDFIMKSTKSLSRKK